MSNSYCPYCSSSDVSRTVGSFVAKGLAAVGSVGVKYAAKTALGAIGLDVHVPRPKFEKEVSWTYKCNACGHTWEETESSEETSTNYQSTNTTNYTENVSQASNCYVISKTECQACGTCKDECPQEAISEGDVYYIDPNKCVCCGVCADACPCDAIIAPSY
jgi:ferredoxin